ncbi:hypothetical protein CJF43_24315 [Pseudomonas fragi]|jgi:hypothetical protein|uniref:Uncharacterized protein n=10 Tax=Pseudomonas TaxID=286 RepID=A0A6A7ZK75_9PSED|nr:MULTISPECIES: hypothetical protein [Pseudomonas]MBK3485786.1 hypothetical protein [Pseudomonas fluorescens]MQU56087.1 hypothetical protein [Pseudomonas sp. FSL R10-1339]APA32350.1 hypothetical protein [Pseudomonas fragi]AVH81854.1 hypothetical protein [Pseudomonas sp. Lz4W]MBJ2260094.1 hypothetical protein [Pseudomonas psychrophila]
MQRLVKPSDYVLQDVLGQSMYQIPWEPRLCPGNPAEDPEAGALLYNAFVQDQAKGVVPRTPAEQMSDILDWVFETAGEPARSLAADLAAAYLGNHAFLIDDLDDWDAETKSHRAHMVFHGEDIRGLSARTVMKLRARAAAGF